MTQYRRSIFSHPENVDLLRNAFRYVMGQHPFKIDAMVVLPEHLHCLWTLLEGDADFSTRWRLIKTWFSRRCHPQYQASKDIDIRDKIKKRKQRL